MKLQDRLSTNAHWLLRIAIAGVFVYHGALKFSNLEGFATMLQISFVEVVFVGLANVGSALVMLYLVITGNRGIKPVGSADMTVSV